MHELGVIQMENGFLGGLFENAELDNIDTTKLNERNIDTSIVDLGSKEKAILEAALADLDAQEQALTESGVLLESPKFRRKKVSILAQRRSRAAVLLARSAGDPMYDKLRFHLEKFREFRTAIRTKYAARAKALVARPGDKDED